MAESNGTPGGVKSVVKASAESYEAVVMNIVNATFQNIIHDLVLDVHRSEKLLRMSSAATLATEKAAAQQNEASTPVTKNAPAAPPSIKVETLAAVYDNGRVYLRGNPLKTVKEDLLCPYCKLPRLLYPITGVNGRLPDLSKDYCTRHPFVSKPGHDIYGNPFPTDMAKTKKERELLKKQEKADRDNTPNSQDTGSPAAGTSNGLEKLNPGSKPASYIPWHTCPNCKRSLLITRFAHHAEKCLGISGRQSSRNAMAKLNNQNGNTPLGSRMGTPQPGAPQNSLSNLSSSFSANGKDKKSPVKRDRDDEDEDAETPKKKKKSSYIKKADRERMAAAAAAGAAGEAPTPTSATSSGGSKIKLKLGKPKPTPTATSATADGDEKPEKERSKRDREDEKEDTPRKKMKLAKEEIQTSVPES